MAGQAGRTWQKKTKKTPALKEFKSALRTQHAQIKSTKPFTWGVMCTYWDSISNVCDIRFQCILGSMWCPNGTPCKEADCLVQSKDSGRFDRKKKKKRKTQTHKQNTFKKLNRQKCDVDTQVVSISSKKKSASRNNYKHCIVLGCVQKRTAGNSKEI